MCEVVRIRVGVRVCGQGVVDDRAARINVQNAEHRERDQCEVVRSAAVVACAVPGAEGEVAG